MLDAQALQTIGAWTVVLAGGFALFCIIGIASEIASDSYRWLRRRLSR